MTNKPDTFVPGFHDENIINKIKYNTFGDTGLKISSIGLGTGVFSDLYGKYTLEECKATVLEALKSGINYIDTAPWYGNGTSEEILGKYLEGVPRQAYYIATKVGRYEKDPEKMFDFSAKKTEKSINESLKKLAIDYVDIIQVHDIEFAPEGVILQETLPTLQKSIDDGKAKFIGVTGYPVSTLAEFVANSNLKIDTVLSYCRLTLFDNTLVKYLDFFHGKKLGVINAAVLGMGLLSSAGPQNWHPASEHIRLICKEANDYCKENGVEIAKLALYHTLNYNSIDTTLVGMNTRELLKSSLQVYFEGLNQKELDIYSYITKHIFSKLKETHWEGVELEGYRKAITQ